MKSSWRLNFLLFGAVVLLCLVGGELIFRWIRPDSLRVRNMPTIMTPDDTLGWRGLPNSLKPHSVGKETIAVRTNEFGFRDAPFPSDRQPKTKKRILFLGDSFCWGFGVEQNDRISEQFEALDPQWESHNFGIFGYSTDQELLTLKMYGARIRPDEVVLLFCLNDLLYNNSPVGHRMPKPLYRLNSEGKLQLTNVPVPAAPKPGVIKAFLRRHSALYLAGEYAWNLVRDRIAWKAQTSRGLSATTAAHAREGDAALTEINLDLQRDITPYLLREMRDECSRLGAHFTVLIVPSSSKWTQERADSPREAEQAAAWCRQENIAVLDLYPEFHQHFLDTGQNLYVADFEDQMHWNGNGHRLAAKILFDYLQRRDHHITQN
jgi:lysophospholipase L1-like esterase